MAGRQGFEPRSDGPEPPVLPLDDLPALTGILKNWISRFKTKRCGVWAAFDLWRSFPSDFGPRITQRHGSIEYQASGGGIGIHTKVA